MPYSGDPADSPSDAVRFWAQDIGNPPLIGDNEIDYLLNLYADKNGADPIFIAAKVADRIVAVYGAEVDITADGVSYSGAELGNKWGQIAATLRADYNELRAMGAQAYVAGVKIGDCAPWGNRPASFRIGQFDNDYAGTQPGGEPGFFDPEGMADYGVPW